MELTKIYTETIPLALPNGGVVNIEIAPTGREEVAFMSASFEQVTQVIEGVTQALSRSMQTVKPSKAVLKFGLEIGLQQGGLFAVIVQGSSKANLEITLEWTDASP